MGVEQEGIEERETTGLQQTVPPMPSHELTEGVEIAQTSINRCMCASLIQSVNGEGKTLDQVHLGCHPFTQVV